MRAFTILTAIFAMTFVAGAALTLEDISTHLPANTPIIWQAPMSDLPKTLWTYRKILPYVFPATVISNAVVLASLQGKDFPRPSTNEFCLDLDTCPCGHPCTFLISPKSAMLSFTSPSFRNGSDVGLKFLVRCSLKNHSADLTMARIAALSGAGSFSQMVTIRAKSGQDGIGFRESIRESA